MIRMPVNVRPDDALSLAVNAAAKRANMSMHDYAWAMTFLFEEIVTQVAKSRTVTMPGFGQWGPWALEGRKSTTKNLPMMTVPRFQSAEGFKNEVMACAVPRLSMNRKMHNYRKNHTQHMASDIGPKRTCKAMSDLRRILMDQARRNAGKVG